MKLISFSLSLALATSAQAANLVQNGGFEEVSLNQSIVIGPMWSDQLLEGWTNAAVEGTSRLGQLNFLVLPGTADTTGIQGGGGGTAFLHGPGNGINNGLTPASPAGGNFIAMDGDPSVSTPMIQTINGLIPGLDYILSFYWAGAQLTSSATPTTGATTDMFRVSLGSETQTTPILENESKGFTGWHKATMIFTPSSTSEVLSFLSVGTPNGLPPMALLDGVSLTATPEPSTWAMMLSSVAALAGFARLRRKAKQREEA